ncbi:MAG TPA: uracil-DNA glycosylase family protein [Thiobacillaceae bacterium]|nr:uracil-DNA glycosylase family protein [Thiobacillaceae bacterium]HNU63863.1 uracil-DNA glycosylase family protein [Thiobacillaceae bacterium]
MNGLDALLRQVRACTVCAPHLPCGPRPVLQAGSTARLLIVGQAPGRKVHDTGIPWNDPSGDRLRDWLGMERATFYDPARIAIIATGLCYPGRGRSGDLPPRPECAPLWHPSLRAQLPDIRLTLLIGQYAQAYYLGVRRKPGLTQTVAAWREYLTAEATVDHPEFPRTAGGAGATQRPPGSGPFLPLPHPSPRNQAWLKRNPWFERELLPVLRREVARALA